MIKTVYSLAVLTPRLAKGYWDVIGKFFEFDFDLAGQITSVPAFIFALALALLAIFIFALVIWSGGLAILASLLPDVKKLQKSKYRDGDWKKYVAAVVFVIILTSGGVVFFQSATKTLEDTVVDPAQQILEESQNADDEEDQNNDGN